MAIVNLWQKIIKVRAKSGYFFFKMAGSGS
jgi:hypothetical protein